ncbi:DUF1622 domain-containing protein [Virgisporangium aurantiacum]|uniref:Membrane protein n=1 Tax=Virgisporangium aurantiacum TaxID=175570 RepID=A0A8J3ZIE7_9ACTN|nr:DUF1622 domain-containing protein [Virgisporangium aurantiacum]GIJ62505.1 membrane protein [Virgisporangium aurantiacum]
MTFHETMELVVTGFEAAGVAILIFGSLAALMSAAAKLRHGDGRAAYTHARQDVGRAILLGLEVLIIADIVQTITVDPTLNNALTLGLIVLVRTFLSFSLEIELDGTLPWRRNSADTGPAGAAETASTSGPAD